MKTGKIITGILTIVIMFPIRIYLMWYILKTINAGELPMFLFWVTVPLGLLIMIISEVIKSASND